MELTSQEMELIVNEITKKVKKEIKKTSGIEKSNNLSVKKKHVLVVLPNFIGDMKRVFDYIEKKYIDYNLTIGTQISLDTSNIKQLEEVFELKDENSREKLMKTINNFDEVCFISLGLKQMDAIIQGDDTGFIESLTMHFLLHAKPVNLLITFNIHKLPKNSFSKKVSHLMMAIKDIGISINVLGEEREISKSNHKKDRDLITQRDIEDMRTQGLTNFYYNKGSIVTPLAKDRAKELGINIIQVN